MKLISKIAVLSAAVIMTTSTVFAITEQTSDGKGVTISGKGGEPNVPVAIEVYTKGKNATDLKGMSEDEMLKTLVCYDAARTNSNGDYGFTFDITLGSGEYTAYIAVANNAAGTEDFVYISNEDFKTAIEQINSAADKSAIEECIKKYPYELGLDSNDAESISITQLAEIFYNIKTKLPFDSDNREETQRILKRAIFVQKLNEGKISNIYAEPENITMLNNSSISEWYKKAYVKDNLKSDFNARMSRQSLKSIDDYMNWLDDAFILATVRYPNGNGNIEDIVNAFKDEIGLSGISIKNSVWSDIAGQNISNLSDLKSKIESLNKGGTNGGSGSGSGGGSRSGGSYSSVSNTEISDMSKNDEPAKIPLDIYDDLDGFDWAKTAIVAMTERKIISGDGDGKFRPADNITREEFCKLVVNTFGLSASNNDASFSDVNPNEWYAESVNAAAENNVVNGTGNGEFGIGMNITREDMAVMIYRAYRLNVKKIGEYEKEFAFADDENISDYAKEAVYVLKNMSVINGTDNGNFAPKSLATRAEASKMLYGLIQD